MVILTNEDEIVEELTSNMAELVKIKHSETVENSGTDENSCASEDDAEMKDVAADITAAVKNKNQNLLSHFWNLATLDESIRSDSVVNLLDELKKTRKQVNVKII